MRSVLLSLTAAAALLCGCTSAVETRPTRTATEQLLISHAAEKAARGFWSELKPGTAVYLDARHFRGEWAEYAISTLRQGILAQGGRLAETPAAADVITEIRLGALSIDQTSRVLGVPSLTVPVSSDMNTVRVPELSVYSRSDRTGVAEFSAFAYDARNGEPVAMGIQGSGSTHIRSHKLLMVFTWGDQVVSPGDAALDPQPWWKLW